MLLLCHGPLGLCPAELPLLLAALSAAAGVGPALLGSLRGAVVRFLLRRTRVAP